MENLIQGIIIGLSLTIMVGPITLTIIDASLADGWKAGMISAGAMWMSDLAIIALIYFGGQEVMDRLTVGGLSAWVSFAAAVILFTIGVVLWFLRNKKIDLSQSSPKPGHMAGHAIRGFLVNTFSPFTLIFWPTLIAGKVLSTEMTPMGSKLFFTGIMGALITGDTLKAFFAHWIRQRISDKYMRYTRVIIATAFILGGLYMAYEGFTAL